MLLDKSAIRELARATFVDRPLTLRRARYLATFGSMFFTMRGLIDVALKLDDVLYPEYRQARVHEPFFIFANPRSGTTLLQYLMTLDEERFTHFKFWQTVFPTVSFNRLISALARADAALGSPMNRFIEAANERFFGRWEGVHNMGFRRPEEDEAIFVYTGNAPGLILMFPEVPALPHVNATDRLPAEYRKKLMDYYESVLQRHVYATGGDRAVLNKNVFTASRVRAIYDKFPDARFIYLVRHPYDAIPSCINLFYVPWTAHSPEIPMASRETYEVAWWAIHWYKLALDFRTEVPPEQMMVVKFEEMMKDPVAMVERIYDHFGMEMTDAYRERLREATQRRNTEEFKSVQKFTLEDWGISRDFVYEQLQELFEEFGYER